MAKICPLTNKVVLYLTCLECEDKGKCKDIKKEGINESKSTDSKVAVGSSKAWRQ